MRRPLEIARDQIAMGTIVNLTNAFEGLASLRIAQIKGQVLHAQHFFDELWKVYHQVRVDSLFRYGRKPDDEVIGRQLFIAITAEGGFSGDIDQRLIERMRQDYDPAKHDIIIIGHHGALQLRQAGIAYKKYFAMPKRDQDINVGPLVAEIKRYESCTVYYQTYASLMTQQVAQIELSKAVQELGREVATSSTISPADVISERSYIFEPDSYAVAAHLERVMLHITLGQVILDSKLAQYASRFRAMRMAHERSVDSYKQLRLDYNRAKRMQSDERLKEITNGLKRIQAVGR